MTRNVVATGIVVTVVITAIAVPQAQQAKQSAVAAKLVSGRIKTSSYVPPKTPWGDPDIQGGYSNVNENGIPFEKPGNLANRQVGEILFGNGASDDVAESRCGSAIHVCFPGERTS